MAMRPCEGLFALPFFEMAAWLGRRPAFARGFAPLARTPDPPELILFVRFRGAAFRFVGFVDLEELATGACRRACPVEEARYANQKRFSSVRFSIRDPTYLNFGPQELGC